MFGIFKYPKSIKNAFKYMSHQKGKKPKKYQKFDYISVLFLFLPDPVKNLVSGKKVSDSKQCSEMNGALSWGGSGSRGVNLISRTIFIRLTVPVSRVLIPF